METANTELAQIKLSLAQVAVAPASTEDVEATLKKTEKQLHAAKAALASAKRENLSLRDHETKLNDQVAQLQANIHELAAELKAQQSQKSKSDQVRPDVAILQNTIKRLQRDLEAARIQERDMQELLESEQKKQLQLQQSLQETLVAQAATSPTGGSPGRNGRPFTAPIRDSLDVLKTMRRNQTLINEVTSQRFENDRLRSDNASLLLHVKDATRASSDLHNQVATSYAHRMELQRRLFKTQSEKKLWEAQLNKTAARTIRRHQLIKEADEEYQWTQIEVMQNRSNSGKTSFGKNTGVPRGTRNIQVDKWSNMNTIEM